MTIKEMRKLPEQIEAARDTIDRYEKTIEFNDFCYGFGETRHCYFCLASMEQISYTPDFDCGNCSNNIPEFDTYGCSFRKSYRKIAITLEHRRLKAHHQALRARISELKKDYNL